MSSSNSSVARHEPRWDSGQFTIPFPGIFDRESGDEELSLRASYEKFLLPDQKLNSIGQRQKFDTVLNSWELFWEGDGAPIGTINKDHLRRFRDWLAARCSEKSTNVYLAYIEQILQTCQEANVLEVAPRLKRLRVRRSLPEIVWLEQLGPWYDACRVATWPEGGIPAPLWWRSLLVFCFTFGFRTTDVVQLNNSEEACRRKNTRPQGMDWSMVCDAAACPIASVPLTHSLGWLYLRPGKTETHKAELALPLTAVVRKHLDALPRPRSPVGRKLILPAPVCCSSFTEQNIRIQQEAGFSLKTDRRGRRQAMTPQMLRRSCKSYWTRLSPEVSRYIGGWSPRSVDERNYLQPLAALLEPDDRGERLIDRFRYPESFLKGP